MSVLGFWTQSTKPAAFSWEGGLYDAHAQPDLSHVYRVRFPVRLLSSLNQD